MMRVTNPLVSVCCIAYNQEKHIKDAINGFLMQKTDFEFEIIIHDDCSTDKTAKIIRTYQKKYPELIVAIIQTENQKSKGEAIFPITYQRARGKYIALCEGDDYWTDPFKLKKQVYFLEKNKDFALTHHKVDILERGRVKADSLNVNTPEITTINDLVKGNYIRTLSVLFRNPQSNAFFAKLPNCPIGDFPLYLILLDHFKTKIKFLNKTMGVYRIHEGGIHENKSTEYKRNNTAITVEILINSSIIKDKGVIQMLKELHHALYWKLYNDSNNNLEMMKYLNQSVKYSDKYIQSTIYELNNLKNSFPIKLCRFFKKLSIRHK